MADDASSPGTSGGRRVQGLRRWEEWLAGRLSPHGIVRQEASATGSGDAVWRIGFREGGWGRVRVSDRAVRLGEHEFDVLTDRLERVDWIRRLQEARPGGIRILRSGAIERVDPDGGAGENEA